MSLARKEKEEFERLLEVINTHKAGKANFQATIRNLQNTLADINSVEMDDIRDEMDGDMEDSGMAQGEIESCLNHWRNKYYIFKKQYH